MSKIQNIASKENQLWMDSQEVSRWLPCPKIKSIALEASRLCYLCKHKPVNEFFSLELGSHLLNENEPLLVFWQYLGNNLKTIECLEAYRGDKMCIIIDDAYEGLLTKEKVEYIEEKISKITPCYFIATSNTLLDGKNILHVNFHLMNKNFDNIIPLNHEYQGKNWGRQKKLLCLNGIPRPHRLKIVDYLIEIGAHDSSYISCTKQHILDTIYDPDDVDDVVHKKNTYSKKQEDFLNTDFFDAKHTGFHLSTESKQRLETFLPLTLDIEQIPQDSKYVDSGEQYYNDSYWSIVTERDFLLSDKFRGFTEKIYKCFLFKHPFLVCGLPHTLDYLQLMGFVTFDGFIDESYDSEEDNDKRMELVQEQIKKLHNMTLSEHFIMREQMQAILDYNRNRYIQLHSSSIPNRLITAIQQWYYST